MSLRYIVLLILPPNPKRCLFLLVLAGGLLLSACGRGRRVLEVVYITAPQVVLRDRVAPVYNKVGLARNGERVEVLDRERRFVKVRTSSGAEGWIEQRYTITQQVFDQLQKLAGDNRNDPVQAPGITRNETNLHLEPVRDSEHLYQLNQGAKLFILKRATTEKEPAAPPGTQSNKEAPQPVMEDWWLVRDAEGQPQLLLTLDSRRLLADYQGSVRVAKINTGATIGMQGRRGPRTWLAIDKFPGRATEVKEFTVLDGISEVMPYLVSAELWHGGDKVEVLHPAKAGAH